jgi:hypothetical protein
MDSRGTMIYWKEGLEKLCPSHLRKYINVTDSASFLSVHRFSSVSNVNCVAPWCMVVNNSMLSIVNECSLQRSVSTSCKAGPHSLDG